MTKKRAIFLALTVVSLTFLSFLRASLLTANDADLIFYKKAVDADLLNSPLPGSAYAFHMVNGDWEATPLCNLQETDLPPILTAVTIRASNSIGVSFNDVVTSVIGFMGDKIVNGLKVKEPEKTWVFNKEFKPNSGGMFQSVCIPMVEQRVNDKDFNVFIVDTVFYYPENSEIPFMVMFKPKPFLVEGCGDNCLESVSLDNLMDRNWATTAKARWSFLKFL